MPGGFNLPNHSDFIKRHGEYVNYSVGMKCSCSGSVLTTGSSYADPNRANITCKVCGGLGIFWQTPTTIIGIVTNIEQHKDLVMAGVAQPGDLVFSPDLQNTLSSLDKIQLTWSDGVPYEGELIVRSSTGNTDTTFYGVTSVVDCLVADPVTGNITHYKPNVDFTFNATNPTNSITWNTGKGPAAGTVYSLKYAAVIDWIAFVPPRPRYDNMINIGQRVVLKKKHTVNFGT